MRIIRKNLRPILIIIVVAFIVSIFYGLGRYQSSNDKNQNTGQFIATINDQGITYQQWHNTFINFISRYDNETLSNMSDETLAAVKNSVVQQLVNSTLLYQHAHDKEINIEKAELDKEINQIKDNFDSDEQFNEVLKNNNLTLSQLKDNLTKQLMIDKVIEQENNKINITEQEIKEYYDNNKDLFFEPESRKIKHILVETKEEAKKILDQLKDGLSSFEEVAKNKSIGPSSEKGGDLGYITKGQMVKPFEEAAFALQPGDMSEIIKTEFGYHIILCEDIKKEHQPSLEEAKENIKNILKSQKENEAITALLKQLKENNEVSINYDFTSELEKEEESLTEENDKQAEEQEEIESDEEKATISADSNSETD